MEEKSLKEYLKSFTTKEPDLKPENPNILVFVNDAEASLIGGLAYRPKNEDKSAYITCGAWR